MRAVDVCERLVEGCIPEPNSGCWLWFRGLGSDGYGNISAKRPGVKFRAQKTHRMAWELFKGPIPSDMCVLHRCDVRSCVNPDHLFLGTRHDNDADMRAKNRHSPTPGERGNTRGEQNAQAKLREGDVADIRRRSTENWKVLAKEYGVNHRTIWKVRTGRSWRGDR